MITPNSSTQKPKQSNADKLLKWAIWVVLALFIVVVVAFGGYYYWDRYVYLGDQSPLDKNVEQLEQAIRDDPQNPETRLTLGDYYLSQGLNKEAAEQARQVLNSIPDHHGALLMSGVALSRMNQPEAAIEPLEHFVELRKDGEMAHVDQALEMAYYFLGENYMKRDQSVAAISVLESAIAINRTDADALYQLGRAYQAQERPEDALVVYHRAARLVPDFTEAYSGMIDSYSALGQADHVVYAQGMQALTLLDYDMARTKLESASQAQPDFAPAFLGLALTYEKLGEPEAALAAIERAAELEPNDFTIQHVFGRLQAAANNTLQEG